MNEFVSITVDDKQLQAALARLESSVLDMIPAMRKIAGTLAMVSGRQLCSRRPAPANEPAARTVSPCSRPAAWPRSSRTMTPPRW